MSSGGLREGFSERLVVNLACLATGVANHDHVLMVGGRIQAKLERVLTFQFHHHAGLGQERKRAVQTDGRQRRFPRLVQGLEQRISRSRGAERDHRLQNLSPHVREALARVVQTIFETSQGLWNG